MCAGGTRAPCPHHNRDHCPKKPHRVGSHEQFALPDTPRCVLLAPNDDKKKAALLFYHRHKHITLNLAPSWDHPISLSATVREGLVAAIKDDASAIQRLLLHEGAGLASDWNDSKLRARWRIPAQHILALLACTCQWTTIMDLSDDFYAPISLMSFSEGPLTTAGRPEPSFGLAALDDAAKAFILQQADEAAHDANDIVAYSMLKLWVKEPGDYVPRS